MHHFLYKRCPIMLTLGNYKKKNTINSLIHGPLIVVHSTDNIVKIRQTTHIVIVSKSNKIRYLIADPYRKGKRV